MDATNEETNRRKIKKMLLRKNKEIIIKLRHRRKRTLTRAECRRLKIALRTLANLLGR